MLEGRTEGLDVISCRLKLRPCNRLLAELALKKKTYTKKKSEMNIASLHNSFMHYPQVLNPKVLKVKSSLFLAPPSQLDSNHKPRGIEIES